MEQGVVEGRIHISQHAARAEVHRMGEASWCFSPSCIVCLLCHCLNLNTSSIALRVLAVILKCHLLTNHIREQLGALYLLPVPAVLPQSGAPLLVHPSNTQKADARVVQQQHCDTDSTDARTSLAPSSCFLCTLTNRRSDKHEQKFYFNISTRVCLPLGHMTLPFSSRQ